MAKRIHKSNRKANEKSHSVWRLAAVMRHDTQRFCCSGSLVAVALLHTTSADDAVCWLSEERNALSCFAGKNVVAKTQKYGAEPLCARSSAASAARFLSRLTLVIWSNFRRLIEMTECQVYPARQLIIVRLHSLKSFIPFDTVLDALDDGVEGYQRGLRSVYCYHCV